MGNIKKLADQVLLEIARECKRKNKLMNAESIDFWCEIAQYNPNLIKGYINHYLSK